MPLQDLTPQLRTRLRRVERVVGLFVALATLLLLAGFGYYLYHTAERKGWFVLKCPCYTVVRTAEGLNVGDPVYMMGFSVGQITTIEAQPPDSSDPVYVGFEIRQPYYGYIWTDSKLKIAAAGFLGNRRIEITKGYNGQPLVEERHNRISKLLVEGKPVAFTARQKLFLPPTEEPTLTERAEKLLGQVEKALPNILAITNRVNTVLDNTSVLLTNSNALVTNSSALVAHLDLVAGQVTPLLSNATAITANLRDPHGSLGEWLLPADLHTSVNTNFAALAASLNNTLLNLAAITSNLNTQVQANDQMLGGISKLVVDTDNLVQGLKKHWLLRGAFRPSATPTNAPPMNVSPRGPTGAAK